ncbi:DUF4091 domain-containing protein [Elizabethkingia sp. JS20170427COW]|uniref:DUF4091 domain-containing protein n=1 Tax=Elizabethkingia sp. JS20170427COW TaxID=2583851 RepID=UPI001C8674FF|nr:DUF4091 domain-containing protein [Elizabethkingia sp. JS20170427COW]
MTQLSKIICVGLIGLQSISISAQYLKSNPQDFVEMQDPIKDSLSNWKSISNGFHTSFVSIDHKFPKHLAPDFKPQKQEKVKGWKGEKVSAQILVWSNQPVENIQVELKDFKSKKAKLSSAIAQHHFVRYVMTDEFASGCGHRKPEDFAASLAPDMLDNLSHFNLEKKSVRPIWISIDIPRDTVPGLYTSQVSIKAKGEKIQILPLSLEVINHTLPPASEWKFHLDLWQHPSAIARSYNVKMWSDEHFEALKPIMKRLANAGQKVITTTLNKDPWNVQTFDPYEDMIIWSKKKDGSWTYDYKIFDRWVNLMMDLGINKMINCYSIIPWNNEIHYQDEKTGKVINVVAEPGSSVFKEMWTPFLKDFSQHLQQKDWLDITNIALDERAPEQMAAAFDLIKNVAPQLGVSYADNHKTYKKYPDSKDISIAIGDPYSKEDLETRRAQGLNSTFYVCCSDSFANTFTFSDSAEPVFAGWYALASGFDGMLRWSYNSWVKDPFQDSRFRTWPAGDTYIVYPQNRSSIRFERLLEGVQDYEKVQEIKKILKANGDTQNLEKLETYIQKMNHVNRTPNWNQELNEAKAFLNSL